MKVETDAEGNMVLKEVFSSVILETGGGNRFGICMRDGTFEVVVMPKEQRPRSFWVNMEEAEGVPTFRLIRGRTICDASMESKMCKMVEDSCEH